MNRIVAPPGEARPDFDISQEIAERLGLREQLYPGWTTTRDAYGEWQRVSAGRMCDYSGYTWEHAAGGVSKLDEDVGGAGRAGAGRKGRSGSGHAGDGGGKCIASGD